MISNKFDLYFPLFKDFVFTSGTKENTCTNQTNGQFMRASVSDAIRCVLGLWYANTASIK